MLFIKVVGELKQKRHENTGYKCSRLLFCTAAPFHTEIQHHHQNDPLFNYILFHRTKERPHNLIILTLRQAFHLASHVSGQLEVLTAYYYYYDHYHI